MQNNQKLCSYVLIDRTLCKILIDVHQALLEQKAKVLPDQGKKNCFYVQSNRTDQPDQEMLFPGMMEWIRGERDHTRIVLVVVPYSLAANKFPQFSSSLYMNESRRRKRREREYTRRGHRKAKIAKAPNIPEVFASSTAARQSSGTFGSRAEDLSLLQPPPPRTY